MTNEQMIALGLFLIISLLLYLLTRRIQAGQTIQLRPLSAYKAVHGQVGSAIESGSQLHLTLGNASLIGSAAPTSVASLHVLEHLAEDGCANGNPPLATVGEGTLLPAAQEQLRQAYIAAGRPKSIDPGTAQFLAHDSDPLAYAAGVTATLRHNRVVSSMMIGRFGPEVVLMSEAAARQSASQIIGSDDPTALAVGTALTDNLLVGEEALAAAAYLDGKPGQLAAIQAQDLLRWLTAAAILVFAVLAIL